MTAIITSFLVRVGSIVIGVSVCRVSLFVCLYVCSLISTRGSGSYRRGSARRAMLANSCYVSQGMGVIREKFQTTKVTFKVIQGR